MSASVPGLSSLQVAVESCGVCGQALVVDATRCVVCGSPAARRTFPVLGPRAIPDAMVRASIAQVAVCLVLDTVTVLAAAATVSLALGWASYGVNGRWVIAWLAIGAVIGLAVGTFAVRDAYRRRGRALAGLVLGLRAVDRARYLPAWPVPTSSSRPVFVDVRSGRDPWGLALAPWAEFLPGNRDSDADALATRDRLARRPAPGAVVILFESGQLHWFSGTCVLGRSPVHLAGGDVLALPDLSRQLSASHLLLTEGLDAGGTPAVWLEDLGSATGTWFGRDRESRVPSHMMVKLSPDDRVRLGPYWFRVERS